MPTRTLPTIAELLGDTPDDFRSWGTPGHPGAVHKRRQLETLRADHLAAYQEIRDRADGAGRDMLASEARQAEVHLDEVERADELLESYDGWYRLHGPRRDDAPMGLPPGAIDGSGELRYGRPVPAGRSFAELPDAGDVRDGLTFGGYLRALALGDHDRLNEFRALGRPDAEGMLPVGVLAQVFDRARAASRVLQAGGQIIPLEQGQVRAAAVTSDPTPAWRGEHGEIPESDTSLTPILFDPSSLAVVSKVSWELLQDSRPNVEELLEQIFAEVFAGELDRVMLMGSGEDDEPLGVADTTDVPITPLNAAPDYGAIIRSVRDLRARNYEPSASIMHPRDRAAIEGERDSTGQYVRRPSYLEDHLFLETSKIPTDQGGLDNESSIFTAAWQNVILGVRLDLQIRVLRERYADTGEVGFLGFLRADVVTVRPDAFEMLTAVEPEEEE